MYQGKYTKRAKPYSQMIANNFRPYTEKDGDRRFIDGGCGTFALSVLTGMKLDDISLQLHKGRRWWTDQAMVGFLRKNGYRVKSVTKCDVTRSRGWDDPIDSYHVLLVSQDVDREDETWAVVYKDHYYHSGQKERLSPLEFMNNPLTSVYVVHHPRWDRGRWVD